MQCLKIVIFTRNYYLKAAVKVLAESQCELAEIPYMFIGYPVCGESQLSVSEFCGKNFGMNTLIFHDKSGIDAVSPPLRFATVNILPDSVDELRTLIKRGITRLNQRIRTFGDAGWQLSFKEKCTVRDLLNGLSPEEISKKENKSVKAVSFYKRTAMNKMNVKSLQQLYNNSIAS